MKKLLMIVVATISMLGYGYTKYVFSPDAIHFATAPRSLPDSGRNFDTGAVVTNLSLLSEVELVKCGWYKIVPDTNVVLRAFQYVEVDRYDFYKDTGLAVQHLKVLDGAPREEYTKFRIIGLLRKLGKWTELKMYMEANDLYDLFMSAQSISNDSDEFMAMKPAIANFLDIDLFDLDKYLEMCKDN